MHSPIYTDSSSDSSDSRGELKLARLRDAAAAPAQQLFLLQQQFQLQQQHLLMQQQQQQQRQLLQQQQQLREEELDNDADGEMETTEENYSDDTDSEGGSPSSTSSSSSPSSIPSMLGRQIPKELLEVKMEPALREMISYMLTYSFSKNFNSNTYWVSLIFYAFHHITHYMNTKPRDKITMRNILKAVSPVIGHQLIAINRKKEDLLSFEAVIVLAYMKSDYCDNCVTEFEQFLLKYPEFTRPEISADERAKLYEFSNCVNIVQRLIPAKNNKEHILDLVSRLTEGFAVRRVTGTGMTVETRNRYEIIHREGGLTPQLRPERRIDRTLHPAEEVVKRKRGRPLSIRPPESASALAAAAAASDPVAPPRKRFHADDKLLLLLQAGIGASLE